MPAMTALDGGVACRSVAVVYVGQIRIRHWLHLEIRKASALRWISS